MSLTNIMKDQTWQHPACKLCSYDAGKCMAFTFLFLQNAAAASGIKEANAQDIRNKKEGPEAAKEAKLEEERVRAGE